MNDSYKNIEEYIEIRNLSYLIGFDDMIADVVINKKV